jgi:hypothetical protein
MQGNTNFFKDHDSVRSNQSHDSELHDNKHPIILIKGKNLHAHSFGPILSF